jgi:hypothetical protein
MKELTMLEAVVLRAIASRDTAWSMAIANRYKRKHVTGATRRLYARGLIRISLRSGADWVATPAGRKLNRATRLSIVPTGMGKPVFMRATGYDPGPK